MKRKIELFAIAITLVTATSLLAGAFVLQIGKPSANPEAQAKHAVLVVRGVACAAPEETTVTATAEGIVNGKRETIPLKLIPLSEQSTYALTRQWPAEGKWVITLVEANPKFKMPTSAVVNVDRDSVDFGGIMRFNGVPSRENIDAALNTTLASKL